MPRITKHGHLKIRFERSNNEVCFGEKTTKDIAPCEFAGTIHEKKKSDKKTKD
jgi:hypothetical protein